MLFRLWRWLTAPAASETHTGHVQNYVSREQLDDAIEHALREVTYEWNEMYEKFNALHLRLSKRVKREQKDAAHQTGIALEGERRPGVISLRRLGSP